MITDNKTIINEEKKFNMGRPLSQSSGKSLSIRVVFMIDEIMDQELEKILNETGVSKATYIRKLIQEDINKKTK